MSGKLANKSKESEKRAAAVEEAIPAKRPKLRKTPWNAGSLAAGIPAFATYHLTRMAKVSFCSSLRKSGIQR